MKTVYIQSSRAQSNSAYHRTGKPTWWAAYDQDGTRTFLTIPHTRGDRQLVATVEIPDGVSELHIGAGRAGAGKAGDAYRETITVTGAGLSAPKDAQ